MSFTFCFPCPILCWRQEVIGQTDKLSQAHKQSQPWGSPPALYSSLVPVRPAKPYTLLLPGLQKMLGTAQFWEPRARGKCSYRCSAAVISRLGGPHFSHCPVAGDAGKPASHTASTLWHSLTTTFLAAKGCILTSHKAFRKCLPTTGLCYLMHSPRLYHQTPAYKKFPISII